MPAVIRAPHRKRSESSAPRPNALGIERFLVRRVRLRNHSLRAVASEGCSVAEAPYQIEVQCEGALKAIQRAEAPRNGLGRVLALACGERGAAG
jgi:hypothetical protein